MKKPKPKRLPFLKWMAKIHSNFYTQIEHATILKTINKNDMAQPVHRTKVDTSLEIAYKAIDVVLNYEPHSFAEVESLKAVNREELKQTRDKLKAAFDYSLTLKPKH